MVAVIRVAIVVAFAVNDVDHQRTAVLQQVGAGFQVAEMEWRACNMTFLSK